MQKWIKDIITEKKEILDRLLSCGYLDGTESAGLIIIDALKKGNKILVAGNGGSAADAQHFAGEMVGRFTMEREALPAISLCTDPSVVTSIANDYGYKMLFEREVRGLGRQGDVFVAISTSGNSDNCINAIETAKKMGISVIGLLGKDGGKMKELCDVALVVPSSDTPRIQEVHTLTVHLLCEMIEKNIFGD